MRKHPEYAGLETWQVNYLNGTKYELYRVPLLQRTFAGYKYNDVVMILYHKMDLTLIGLEIKVGDQIKVFVNPTEYVFGDSDHWGYVIHYNKPDFNELNDIDLENNSAQNMFIMTYINKREVPTIKKDILKIHRNLATLFSE